MKSIKLTFVVLYAVLCVSVFCVGVIVGYHLINGARVPFGLVQSFVVVMVFAAEMFVTTIFEIKEGKR